MQEDKKTWIKDVLDLCSEFGYRTSPVMEDGKVYPFKGGKDYKNISAYKNASHIALILDDCVLLDYDGNKSDDIMSEDELASVLDDFAMPEPNQKKEQSIHWLYRLPEDLDRSTIKASADGYWPHIDIKTGNQIMHIKMGKELNLVPIDELEICPDALIKALTKSDEALGISSSSNDDLGDFTGLLGNSNTSREKVEQWVFKLDNNMPNSEWVKVGQALHHWDPIQGLEIWEEWSKGGHTYSEGETEKRWSSFTSSGGVTLGTISYMAKVIDYDQSKSVVDNFIESLREATEKDIELSIAPKIQKAELDTMDREKLAKHIQNRIRETSGFRPPIGVIRTMIAPRTLEGDLMDNQEKPKWCDSWAYVNSQAAFFNVRHRTIHKSESFNLICGKHVPMTERGTKPSANKFVADHGFVDAVESIAYLPMCPDAICEVSGKRVVNTFDAKSLPKPATEFTEKGLKAIERVKNHIRLICNFNEEHYWVLLQWIAQNVQEPGRKILWAPLIQSIEGAGKSWFAELLGVCLGPTNIGTVSPTQATSNFNGWAMNKCVNVLNELRVKGHNRYEATNALKPLITDSFIQINDKGVKQFQTLNTTNYICFTNYKDAIPMEQDGRRWWVLFVDLRKLSDIEIKTGEKHTEYFPNLFNAVREHGPEIHKWILEQEVSKEFKNLNQAPETSYKKSMVETEKASHELLHEIEDLIERGGQLYNSEVIHMGSLIEDLTNEMFGSGVTITTQKVSQILKSMGYIQPGIRFRPENGMNQVRFWAKNSDVTVEDVKKSLNLE